MTDSRSGSTRQESGHGIITFWSTSILTISSIKKGLPSALSTIKSLSGGGARATLRRSCPPTGGSRGATKNRVGSRVWRELAPRGGPPLQQGRPGQTDQHQRRFLALAGQMRQRVQGSLVTPMNVLHHQQQARHRRTLAPEAVPRLNALKNCVRS